MPPGTTAITATHPPLRRQRWMRAPDPTARSPRPGWTSTLCVGLRRQAIAWGLLLLGMLAGVPPAAGADGPAPQWPLVVIEGDWELHLFHPVPESLDGQVLTARAGVSLIHRPPAAPAEEPRFGVVWLSAQVAIDREERTIRLLQQSVTRVVIGEATDADRHRVEQLVLGALAQQDRPLSLDRILTRLHHVQMRQALAGEIKTDVPTILVSTTPAVLVQLDGDPRLEPIDATGFARAVNTPFVLVQDQQGQAWWLAYGGRWYTAPALAGSWRAIDDPPDRVHALEPILVGQESDAGAPAPPLQILVATTPSELIACDGDPVIEPIPGTTLLGVSNTDRDVLIDPASQRTYALLAGRWYATSDLLHGPWQFVHATALPPGFAAIPADSRYGDVRAAVAGTLEAEEAARDAGIPQTAAVRRDATITVSYDGDPQWEPIPNSSLQWCVNSPDALLWMGPGQYACCAQGVWYVAPTPQGPWTVALHQPHGLAAIPPSCPLYGVQDVTVYEADADVVWVGYDAGYLGCCILDGCVVWGTGWVYPCWWHHHYYGRRWTWGLGMHYDPWLCRWGTDTHAGWGGWDGRAAFGSTGVHGPWWGPGGYLPITLHHPLPLAPGHAGLPRGGNLYRLPENHERIAPLRPQPQAVSPLRTAPEGERLYPGEHGEVYRHPAGNWQQWDAQAGWSPVREPPAAPPPAREPAPTRLAPEEQAHDVERGEQRSQRFETYHANPAPIRMPFSGGGSRGGGRGGR